MKSLTILNEAFIERANRSVLQNVPITVKASRTLPVLPSDRWMQSKTNQDKNSTLTKAFEFQNNDHRDRFILGLIDYENYSQHRASVTFEDMKVVVTLVTKHIDIVTELDKDYTKFCDTLYRDVIYDRVHGRPHRQDQNFDEP